MAQKACDTCKYLLESNIYPCSVCGGTNFTYVIEGSTSSYDDQTISLEDDDEPYEYKHSLNKTIRDCRIPLSTTFEIPGRVINNHLAMISGVGNARFTLTGGNSRLTNRAATKALKNLTSEANRIKADAIIGVAINLDTYGSTIVNQIVIVTGTAVTLR